MIDEPTSIFHELVYEDSKVADKIKGKFPALTITDARDYIHTERFAVKGDVSEEDFYVFAIREGFALGCLGLRIGLYDKEMRLKIDKWGEQAKKENKKEEQND